MRNRAQRRVGVSSPTSVRWWCRNHVAHPRCGQTRMSGTVTPREAAGKTPQQEHVPLPAGARTATHNVINQIAAATPCKTGEVAAESFSAKGTTVRGGNREEGEPDHPGQGCRSGVPCQKSTGTGARSPHTSQARHGTATRRPCRTLIMTCPLASTTTRSARRTPTPHRTSGSRECRLEEPGPPRGDKPKSRDGRDMRAVVTVLHFEVV